MRSKLHQFVIVIENPVSRLLVFCFLILYRLRLCVSTLVSVLWDFLSFVCVHSHVGIVLVLRTYACWMGVGQNYAHPVLQMQISCAEIFDSHAVMWKRGFGICMKTISKDLKRHDTLHFFTIYWIHSVKSVFKCGTEMQVWEWNVCFFIIITALPHLAGSLLVLEEMEKDVQRHENKPRRPNEYSTHSSLTLR